MHSRPRGMWIYGNWCLLNIAKNIQRESSAIMLARVLSEHLYMLFMQVLFISILTSYIAVSFRGATHPTHLCNLRTLHTLIHAHEWKYKLTLSTHPYCICLLSFAFFFFFFCYFFEIANKFHSCSRSGPYIIPSVCWKSEIIEFLKGRVSDSGETVDCWVSASVFRIDFWGKIAQMTEIVYVRTVT